MRIFLLAVLTAVFLMPQTADAARRDERSTLATSRAQPSQAARPAARQAAPRATARQAAPRQATRSQATRRPASTRQAALRPGDVRSQRQGIVVRGAAAATLPRGPATYSRSAARNSRTAANARRNGRANSAAVERPLSWQAGLPSANNAQRDCPAGTLATLARGHNDVVRCMPL